MNFPVDRRGLIHENDAKAVLGLRRLIDATYGEGTDLARGRTTASDNMRGFVPLGAHEKPLPLEFGADRLVDGDPKTYWATADGTKAAMVEVELDAAKPFDRVVLAEPTWLGQRVRRFRISVPATPDDNHRDWTVIAEGTTIGHKRIVRVPETKAKYLRVEILDARACPCLTTLSVHKTKVPG